MHIYIERESQRERERERKKNERVAREKKEQASKN